ncbi:response regulator transcription factor [Nannocystis sp.]|uniref:response regulator transcription factor n=1 Tax=Nannocystis sp. TaxID=1962667 RepID=UPI0025F03DF1|nr:response regulator transcription factor [Nannocystis sp.]MBK7830712.1 response regulator transcription factor [Nannocystis sp.]
MRVLLIEDNERLVAALGQGLREEGIDVVAAGEAGVALARAARGDLDLVVLDLGLPDRDGMDVLRDLRSSQSHVPILVLTARDAVESRVQALNLGADDYLLKPFAFAELLARIRALSRRAAGPRWSPRVEGVVSFDDEHGVQFADQRVLLSPREHAMLAYLVRRRGEVVPRGDILREVFGYVSDPGTNAIDVHLTHLRRKLAGTALTLETIRGVGIRVKVEER